MNGSRKTSEALLAAKAINAFKNPPTELFPLASRFMADFCGVTIAGAASEPVERVRQVVDDPGLGNINRARPLLHSAPVALRSAAIVNGMAGHFHDFDDDDPAVTIAHPSVASLAAALAIADAVDPSGAELLAAYIVGAETMSRIARVCNPSHYNNGWHATATLGIYGATVASGLLLDLSEEELTHAIGIAASLSAGIKANFGSDMKPLQVGQAAGNGVWAAQLAKQGINSTAGSVFSAKGYLSATGAALEDSWAIMEGFGAPYCFVEPGFNVKMYPCCSSAHTSMDATIELMTRHAMTQNDIAKIDVWTGKDAPTMLIFDVPSTGLQGKFSLRYCVAVAAYNLAPSLSDFTDAAIERSEVQELLGKTFAHIDESFQACGPEGVTHQARVQIQTHCGQVFEQFIEDPLGSHARPASDDRLWRKFASCAEPSLGLERAKSAYELILRTDRISSSRTIVEALMRVGQ
jgi:2-methylcitrate dehydratase PrpD